MSHDWTTPGNHERVLKIAERLENKHGLKCWIDKDNLNGGIIARRITRGIRDSMVFACFMTKSYSEKVAADTSEKKMADWCFIEFHAALNIRSVKYMLPIVMDTELLNTKSWSSILIRGLLGGKAYIDMTNSSDAQIDILAKRIKRIEHK
jgi:hypothetical protein